MQIDIYDLNNTPEGKKQGDVFLAQVTLTDEGVRVETYDKKLKEKLEDIFSSQLLVRKPTGNIATLITHHYEIAQPFTEEFFEIISLSLFRHNLFGLLRRK
jgi:hypothetical protein